MSDFLDMNINDDGICEVLLKREPVNALSFNFLKELRELFTDLESNNSLRVVIIKSITNHFSAGADLKERKIMSKEDSGRALDNFNDCFNVIENFSKPTICSIHGYCLGGGAELALSCDIRVGAEDCVIGFPEVSIGIIPGAGGTQRLPKIIGLSNAIYWIYTANKFSGKESFDHGFLNFVVNHKDLDRVSFEIAQKIIKNAPIAITSSKFAINNGYNKLIDKGLIIERDSYNVSLNTKDREEALSAFMEKRKPNWENK